MVAYMILNGSRRIIGSGKDAQKAYNWAVGKADRVELVVDGEIVALDVKRK